MADYNVVRCLVCTTGKEEIVVHQIHEHGWGQAIFPRRIKTILKNKKWLEMWSALFPGYVFLYTEDMSVSREKLMTLRNVIRLLDYGESGCSELVGQDREFADWIWRLKGKIGVMKTLQNGDRIEIIDGVFKQMHGTIIRMDRRRRTMKVELDAQGVIRSVWLAYDIVNKKEEAL